MICRQCGRHFYDANDGTGMTGEGPACQCVDWQAYADLLRRVKSVRKTSGCAMVTSAVDGATLQMPDMIRLDAFDAALPEGKE